MILSQHVRKPRKKTSASIIKHNAQSRVETNKPRQNNCHECLSNIYVFRVCYIEIALMLDIDVRRTAFLRVYVLLIYAIRTGKMDDIALRVSDHVLEVIFSYLDLQTLRNCSLVCKRWNRFLNDENNEAWRMHCIRKLAQEALSSDLLSSVPTYKSKLRAFYHAWNPNDCSRNIYIRPNGFTMHR